MAEIGLTATVSDQLRAKFKNSAELQQRNLDTAARFLDLVQKKGGDIDPKKARLGAQIEKRIQGQADVMEGYVAALSTYDDDMARNLDTYGRSIDQALSMADRIGKTIRDRRPN